MVNVRERLVWRAWTGTGYQGWRQASCAESAMLCEPQKGMMSNEGDARSRLCAAVTCDAERAHRPPAFNNANEYYNCYELLTSRLHLGRGMDVIVGPLVYVICSDIVDIVLACQEQQP